MSFKKISRRHFGIRISIVRRDGFIVEDTDGSMSRLAAM